MNNTKIRDSIFFFIIFTLIFIMIPKCLQMNFLGGPLGDKLCFYPLVLGFVYTVYCQHKYGNVFVKLSIVRKYILTYVIVVLCSLILGLYNYPYYDLIINGPITQIEKLPKIIKIFEMANVTVDVKVATIIWMIVRNVKGVLLEAFYTFGGAYMFFCWYRKDWKQGFRVCCSGILASLVVIFSFSFIEVFYLAGNGWAKNILVKITPYFLVIAEKSSAWGWPPILWFQPQLRSIFAEPSYFGLYAAFCMPFLWYMITKNEMDTKCTYIIVTYIMTFFLFLTKARTGVALIFGEFLLLILAVCYIRNKVFLWKFFIIMTCSVFAFISCNLFIFNFMGKNNLHQKNVDSASVVISEKTTDSINVNLQKSMGKYLDSNLKSIATTNKRSNTPRYAYAKAAIKTGMNNFLFGVGKGLTTAYMPQYFTAEELQNKEIKVRIKRSNDLGVLYATIPILNEYAQRFAETGLIGLCLFFAPTMILLHRLIKLLKSSNEYIFFAIAFIGVMVSGFSTIFAVTYCYPVLLGLGYAMCFGDVNKLDNEVFNK